MNVATKVMFNIEWNATLQLVLLRRSSVRLRNYKMGSTLYDGIMAVEEELIQIVQDYLETNCKLRECWDRKDAIETRSRKILRSTISNIANSDIKVN